MTPTLTTALQLSLRSAVSAALAVTIAQFLKFESPVYAVIAAVIVTDLSPSKTRRLAIRRLAGTLLGAAVGAICSYSLSQRPLALVISIAAAMLLSYVVRLQAVAQLSGYVCGIVVLAYRTDPWLYALYRTSETFLGIAMAVLVSFVPKLLRVEIPGETDS